MGGRSRAGALIVALAGSACSHPPFVATRVTSGLSALRIAARDLDGDGRLDLVLADFDTGLVGVLRGLGGGRFAPPVSQPAVAHPFSLAVADFNGDGRPDVAVAGDGALAILPGNGDGTLAAPRLTTMATPNAIAAADLDGDGHVDVALAISARQLFATGLEFQVLRGNGDGTFGAAAHYPTTLETGFVALADVDGDGRLDLVASGSSNFVINPKGDYLRVLRGNGDGTLGPEIVSYIPSASNTVDAATNFAVGDFDGDGHPDLAVMTGSDWGFAIFHGAGDGTFSERATYAIVNEPGTIEAGDFNGDGTLDLVEVEQDQPPSKTIGFWLGNGDGTFRPDARTTAGQYPFGLAVGDLDGDGRLDVAAANWGTKDVTVVVNESYAR